MTDILLSVFPEQCKASPCFACTKLHTEPNLIEPISGAVVSLFARCEKHSPTFFLETCDYYSPKIHEEEL
jgi:hypothetical protein